MSGLFVARALVIVLTFEEVLDIHEAVLDEYPDVRPGIDKPEALRAAVSIHDRGKFYEGGDLAERAALLGAGILLRQVFVDGNHRTAWVVMRVFLRRNGFKISGRDDELLEFLHEYYDPPNSTHRPVDLAEWLRSRLQRL